LYCIQLSRIGIERRRFKDVVNPCSVRQTYLFGRTGAIFCDNDNSDPIIENNIIFENTANNVGGGIFIYHGADPTLINNTIFAENNAGQNLEHSFPAVWPPCP
jgi:parallel beta-helix repeat protein